MTLVNVNWNNHVANDEKMTLSSLTVQDGIAPPVVIFYFIFASFAFLNMLDIRYVSTHKCGGKEEIQKRGRERGLKE